MPGGADPVRILSCAALREWVRQAQPNARLPYGRGAPWATCARHEILEQVLRLQRLGLVTSHFVRGKGDVPDTHLLQRTQRPFLRGMEL